MTTKELQYTVLLEYICDHGVEKSVSIVSNIKSSVENKGIHVHIMILRLAKHIELQPPQSCVWFNQNSKTG